MGQMTKATDWHWRTMVS